MNVKVRITSMRQKSDLYPRDLLIVRVQVYRVVAPKKARLENAQKVLAAKQAELDEALARLDEVSS